MFVSKNEKITGDALAFRCESLFVLSTNKNYLLVFGCL